MVIARDGEVNEELMSLFTCLAVSTNQWKKVTFVLNDHFAYENYQDYIEDEILKWITRFYLPWINMPMSNQKRKKRRLLGGNPIHF